jgi:hypothetical protein
MAVQQKKEGMRFRALVERACTLRIPDGSGVAQDLVELARAQAGKDRDICND